MLVRIHLCTSVSCRVCVTASKERQTDEYSTKSLLFRQVSRLTSKSRLIRKRHVHFHDSFRVALFPLFLSFIACEKSPALTFHLSSGLNSSPARQIKNTHNLNHSSLLHNLVQMNHHHHPITKKRSEQIFNSNIYRKCMRKGKKIINPHPGGEQEAQIIPHRLEINKLTANKDITGNTFHKHTHAKVKQDEHSHYHHHHHGHPPWALNMLTSPYRQIQSLSTSAVSQKQTLCFIASLWIYSGGFNKSHKIYLDRFIHVNMMKEE